MIVIDIFFVGAREFVGASLCSAPQMQEQLEIAFELL